MAYFKKLTSTTRSGSSSGKKNAVIMGRKTWESIPAKFRPLAGRINVVLSKASEVSDIQAGVSDGSAMKDVIVSRSLEDAMDRLEGPEFSNVVETVFVIGGGQVYKAAMESPRLSAVHLTVVEGDIECDTFMVPVDETKYKLWAAGSPRRDAPDGPRYSFLCYTRWSAGDDVGGEKGMTNEDVVSSLPPAVIPQHEEYQYLDMIDSVIREGVYRGDRTGTGTFSSFGRTMRFNLRHTFPLLTTKRVFWRGRNIKTMYLLSYHGVFSMMH
jgi:dihydrofolate reductase/thymidylate synthase